MSQNTTVQITGAELWQWRQTARQQAVAADIPPSEVDWLLQALSGLDRLSLRLGLSDTPIELKRSIAEISHLWQQRLEARVPLQYLVGTVPWRQFMLQVSPAVLIPRPETELLIDLAIATVQAGDANLAQGHWADLGTGSGAIAIGLADAFPQATIHAVDLSQAALAIAQRNAEQLNFGDQIRFYEGSWFQPLECVQGAISGMVSNPPYIPSSMVPDLQPEVADHEPHLALDGGSDGLEAIRHLAKTAPIYLKSGGLWLVEIMAGQAAAVVDLLRHDYTNIQVHADLAGIDRFVSASCC